MALTRPASASGARLQLRMVLCQGLAVGRTVPLQPCMSLAHVLELSPVAVPYDQIEAAERCRIVSAAGSWWLENQGAELRCCVNGQPVMANEQVRLNDGDVLEAGLVRYVVESAAPGYEANAEADVEISAETAETNALGKSVAPRFDAYPDFRLTDLLDAPDSASSSSDMADTIHDTPLHDILDAAYRLDLDATDTSGAPASKALTDTPGADQEEPLIRELHREYLILMHDPHGVAPAHDWNQYALSRERSVALEELQGEEIHHDGLYDLLGEPDTIAWVIEQLDTLGEGDFLEPEAPVDVLRLFAPDDLREERNALPELTRREHHVLSADSAASVNRVTRTNAYSHSTEPKDKLP